MAEPQWTKERCENCGRLPSQYLGCGMIVVEIVCIIIGGLVGFLVCKALS